MRDRDGCAVRFAPEVPAFGRYSSRMLRCAFCGESMVYVHGHAACVRSACPMFGVNQDECCSGDAHCVATSAIARGPRDAAADEDGVNPR